MGDKSSLSELSELSEVCFNLEFALVLYWWGGDILWLGCGSGDLKTSEVREVGLEVEEVIFFIFGDETWGAWGLGEMWSQGD